MAFYWGSLGFLAPFQFSDFRKEVTQVLEGSNLLIQRFENFKKYLPPATKLGQGYVYIPVCNSVHGQTSWIEPPPAPGRYPPADTPPPTQCMLKYGQQAVGTHPTGIQTCYIILLEKISKIRHCPQLSISCAFVGNAGLVLRTRLKAVVCKRGRCPDQEQSVSLRDVESKQHILVDIIIFLL